MGAADVDVLEVERRLSSISALRGDGALEGIKKPTQYYRKYLGLVIDGRKWMYINAVKAEREPAGWRTRLADVCNGGRAAWGVMCDLEAHRFSQLRASGA